MSVLRLVKDHGDQKKGAIINLPFMAARDLVTGGVAEYWAGQPETLAAVPASATAGPASVLGGEPAKPVAKEPPARSGVESPEKHEKHEKKK